jgi:hypothetical protein
MRSINTIREQNRFHPVVALWQAHAVAPGAPYRCRALGSWSAKFGAPLKPVFLSSALAISLLADWHAQPYSQNSLPSRLRWLIRRFQIAEWQLNIRQCRYEQ